MALTEALLICRVSCKHRAWLNESAVEEFKLSSLFSLTGPEHFSAKVFESNSNYRLAIMEAVRIAYNPDDSSLSQEEADKNASLYAMALKLIRKHEPVCLMCTNCSVNWVCRCV